MTGEVTDTNSQPLVPIVGRCTVVSDQVGLWVLSKVTADISWQYGVAEFGQLFTVRLEG